MTSLSKAETNGRLLYEKVYCARGDMENRIKECQGDLFAYEPRPQPCAPTNSGYGSPLSPMFSSARSGASALRTRSLPKPTCGTIRLKLLKLAGLVRISARRIKFALASACPYADERPAAAARLA